MHALFQKYLFLLGSAMACNDLVEKNDNLFNCVGLNRRYSRLCGTRFLCLSTLATSVVDIEALELAEHCRHERVVLPAAVFNFSQVEQLRNFENLYRTDACKWTTMLCNKKCRQIAKKRPSGFGRGSLRNKILKAVMSASPDQKSSASTSQEKSGSRSVAIFQVTCASIAAIFI
jgi:hypothetical protein